MTSSENLNRFLETNGALIWTFGWSALTFVVVVLTR